VILLDYSSRSTSVHLSHSHGVHHQDASSPEGISGQESECHRTMAALVSLPEIERLSSRVIRILGGNPGKVYHPFCRLPHSTRPPFSRTQPICICFYLARMGRPLFRLSCQAVFCRLTRLVRTVYSPGHQHLPCRSRPQTSSHRHWRGQTHLDPIARLSLGIGEGHCRTCYPHSLASRPCWWCS
jgi:hypothetical protein